MLEVPINGEDRWQIQSDCETLMRAREVIADEKRLKAAQEYFENQRDAFDELSKSDYWQKIGIRK